MTRVQYTAVKTEATVRRLYFPMMRKVFCILRIIQIGESSAETSGVLKLSVSGNSLVIAEGVSSSYMSAPIANADMSEIYYCVKREGKLFDLYRYSGGESTLLVENVHGLIALENGKSSLS